MYFEYIKRGDKKKEKEGENRERKREAKDVALR